MSAAARYCSQRCRSAWRKAQPAALAAPEADEVLESVAAELERLGLADHPLAAIAGRLAAQLDSGSTPPGAMAPLAKQLAALLTEARDLGHEPEPDFVDELRARIRAREVKAQ